MKKKLLIFSLAAAMLLTGLAGCGKDGDTKEDGGAQSSTVTKVRLNEVAHSIFYAPMYVAIEEGYFAEEGIELELITGFGVILLVQDKNFKSGNPVFMRVCETGRFSGGKIDLHNSLQKYYKKSTETTLLSESR